MLKYMLKYIPILKCILDKCVFLNRYIKKKKKKKKKKLYIYIYIYIYINKPKFVNTNIF